MCETKEALVLVIDDCQDNLLLMELILTHNGYRVEKANCGKEGIAKIHELTPDLIILDMMMPDMTGLEVIEQVKLYQYLSSIPILICTANVRVRKENIKIADSISYKPIDINELLAEVDSLVARAKSIDGLITNMYADSEISQ